MQEMQMALKADSTLRRRWLCVIVLCLYLQLANTDWNGEQDGDQQFHRIRHSGLRSHGYHRQHGDHNNGYRLRQIRHVTGHSTSGSDAVQSHGWPSVNAADISLPVLPPEPIEIMTPVELTEYDWDDSRRYLELSRDVPSHEDDFNLQQLPSSSSSVERRGSVLTSQCGQTEIDRRYSICCDGIIFSRMELSDGDVQCCGNVAYDNTHYACCGRRGRTVIMRRGLSLPSCCIDRPYGQERDECSSRSQSPGGYQTDRTGLGSVCCRVRDVASGQDGGNWRCCLRGERCCDQGAIEIPGFRPACCPTNSGTRTPGELESSATCCARTYERLGILPECCDAEQLRPICCGGQEQTGSRTSAVRCCPATIGYCCGQLEQPVMTTRGYYPIMTTLRPPSQFMQRPTRPAPDTRYNRPLNASPSPYVYDAPRPFSASVAQQDRRADQNIQRTVRNDSVTAMPSCCRSPSLSVCCRTVSLTAVNATAVMSSPTCCRPLCCRVTHFNVTCCLQGHHNGPGTRITSSPRGPSNRQQDQGYERRQGESRGANISLYDVRVPNNDDDTIQADQQHSGDDVRRHVISQNGPVTEPRTVASEFSTNGRGQRDDVTVGETQTTAPATTCAGTTFDAREYICCDGSLRLRIGVSSACCGQVAYDRYLFQCCPDRQIRISCNADYQPRRSIWGVRV